MVFICVLLFLPPASNTAEISNDIISVGGVPYPEEPSGRPIAQPKPGCIAGGVGCRPLFQAEGTYTFGPPVDAA